jgi:polar amino acid transport system substrate-binding protein
VIRISFILAAAAVALVSGPAPSFAQNAIVNGIEADPPFAYVGPDGKAAGFDVEALEWIGARSGFTVEHRLVAWDTIIQSLLDKKIDVIASGFSRTAERTEQLSLTDPYWTIKEVVIVKKDSALSLDEILTGGHSIAVRTGSPEAVLMEASNGKDGRKYTLSTFETVEQAMADVIGGRVDAAVMNSPFADFAVKEQDVRIAGEAGLPAEEYVYAVNRENSELLAKLNAGLAALKADPFWKTLKDKYRLDEAR